MTDGKERNVAVRPLRRRKEESVATVRRAVFRNHLGSGDGLATGAFRARVWLTDQIRHALRLYGYTGKVRVALT